jgi:superfamily II DNA or RNA helicase
MPTSLRHPLSRHESRQSRLASARRCTTPATCRGRGTPADADFVFDDVASRVPVRPYQRELVSALARDVSASAPGARLRITVATGGGKTRIANDWISAHALPRGRRVLWVTKDWTLLRQAAGDLCRRYAGMTDRLGFLGTEGNRHLGPLREGLDGEVVYT